MFPRVCRVPRTCDCDLKISGIAPSLSDCVFRWFVWECNSNHDILKYAFLPIITFFASRDLKIFFFPFLQMFRYLRFSSSSFGFPRMSSLSFMVLFMSLYDRWVLTTRSVNTVCLSYQELLHRLGHHFKTSLS